MTPSSHSLESPENPGRFSTSSTNSFSTVSLYGLKEMSSSQPLVYTPGNEPYLGRTALRYFDELIVKALATNSLAARSTHGVVLSDSQQMACVVIPQAVSLALSIRELIRQGYLFGAHVLVRPLAERACILLYLHNYPEDIAKLKNGWAHREAPSLAQMFEAIQKSGASNLGLRGADLTASMNSLIHGKPDSARWNQTGLDGQQAGHASSKLLHRPDLCDEVSADAAVWLAVTFTMMIVYFPDAKAV
jgi:hypothetical protein